jgi:hypothetical protein
MINESDNFRTVIEYIQEATCPVVGHNAALDLLHTVHHFWQRLPATLDDFRLVVNQMWKTVIDTKYLAQHPKLKEMCSQGTNLGLLYNSVSEQVKQETGKDSTACV